MNNVDCMIETYVIDKRGDVEQELKNFKIFHKQFSQSTRIRDILTFEDESCIGIIFILEI